MGCLSPVFDKYLMWSWLRHRHSQCLHRLSVIGGQFCDRQFTKGLGKKPSGRHDGSVKRKRDWDEWAVVTKKTKRTLLDVRISTKRKLKQNDNKKRNESG